MTARILDRHGVGIWSATPQAGTEQLFELHEKAEQQRNDKVPMVEEYVLLMADNPHLDEEEKVYSAEMMDEDSYSVRVAGEFAVNRARVYPEWQKAIHIVDWFQIPSDWSRYIAIDPGYQVCAVLFGAVPPPDKGDFLYLYDELYLKECNAVMFGDAMESKCKGQQFQCFVIDYHGSIRTETTGKTIQQQFSDELRARKIRSEMTGFDFLYGTEKPKAGVLAVHGYLRMREDGTPKLRILRDMLPNFEWEIKRYRNKVDTHDQPTDEPDAKRNNHTMDALRYMVGLNPHYVKPRKTKEKVGGALGFYRNQLKKRAAMDGGGGGVRLGPPLPQNQRG